MNYSRIICPDIANGTGCRCTLFVSGCRHHCNGCFNSVTWDFNYGQKFTENELISIISKLTNQYIEGLTLLGGEPLEPENQLEILRLINNVKSNCPGKTIWLYTGCTWEELMDPSNEYHTKNTIDILSNIDILVDGQFIEELKDISLKFRGSSNQRIIKSSDSIITGKLILSELN